MSGQHLPVRYWRWTWLGEVMRVISILLILPLLAVYWPAKGVVWGLDWLSDYIYRLRVAMDLADRYKSGWTPPLPPRQRIELNPEWKARLAKDQDA